MKCRAHLCLAVLVSVCALPGWSDELLIGSIGEPETLDPHRYNLRLEETLLNDLFMGLTTFSAAGEIVPGAAQSWQVSDDGLTWTFQIRPGLRWSDGTPLTADDFVYSFRRLQDPKTAASLAYFMSMLKHAEAINRGDLSPDALGVRATDPNTLVLELARPYPYLLERLLYPTAYPVPAHIIEQHGNEWTKPKHWVSNGAYTLSDWQPQAHVAMQANPNFVDTPAITKVRYINVTSEQSAFNRYRNKELHAIASFPAAQLNNVRNTYGDEVYVSNLLSMMYLVFNTEHPALADVRVRQALSLAIDQAVLADKVLRAGYQPAYSFAPSLIGDYAAVELPHRRTAMTARQQQARELLSAAGFNNSNPLQLTLRHVSTLEGKKVNLAISGMWRQVGVLSQLQQTELRSHFAALRQGDFEVAWAGWVGENNAEHYLSLLQSDIGNVNYGRYQNPAYDKLMRQAQLQAELSQRNQLLHDAEQLMVTTYPVVPLYTLATRRLVSTKIVGWQNNLRDVHQVRYLNWR